MDLRLKDKRALVTGSTRGLGYATALLLAREGCRVAINGRDEEKVKSAAEKIHDEAGTEAAGFAGDVSHISVPQMLIRQTVEAFGGLDILVTNSGGPTPGSIDSLDEIAWQKGINSCLHGTRPLDQSRLAISKEIRFSQRADDYVLFRETADTEFADLQQRPRRHSGTDQISGAGTRQGGNPS